MIDVQLASSTKYVGTTYCQQTLLGVNFADGRTKGYGLGLHGRAKTFFVIFVRGNRQYGRNDLADNDDGTITDHATGLMWSRDDSGMALDWEQALAWVKAQNTARYLGYGDWRLPNAKELQSILDYTRSPYTSSSAAIDPLFHTSGINNEAGETDCPSYWSSTTHGSVSTPPGAAAVYVAFGRSLGYMGERWIDIHGAGAQRSDPKTGDPAACPTGRGPQGDAIRIDTYFRLVRSGGVSETPARTNVLCWKNGPRLACRPARLLIQIRWRRRCARLSPRVSLPRMRRSKPRVSRLAAM